MLHFTFPLPGRRARSALLAGASSAGLALLLGACGGSSFERAVTVAAYMSKCGLPAVTSEPYRVTTPTGTSCVGASIVHAEDESRRDVLGPEPARARSVQLRVWYPAADVAGWNRMPYSSELQYASLAWPDPAAKPAGNALANAPVARGGRFPVLLFSPGMGLPVDLYAGIAEDLASHGYIVVGINHPLTSGPVAMRDGRVVPGFPDLSVDDLPRLAALMVEDQRFVLDWLARQGARGWPFADAMDLARIGSAGHSVGGSAALQAQRLDPRIKAAVNLDGTVWGELSIPWTKPWMILYAQRDRERDPSYALFAAHPLGTSVLAPVAQTGHHDFSDMAQWMRIFRKTLPAAQLPAGAELLHPDPVALEQRLRSDVRGFFDRHVK